MHAAPSLLLQSNHLVVLDHTCSLTTHVCGEETTNNDQYVCPVFTKNEKHNKIKKSTAVPHKKVLKGMFCSFD